MGFLVNILTSVKALFINLFEQPNWRDFVDIFIISIAIYECLKLMIRTRSATVLKGVMLLVMFAWLTDAMQLNVVSWVMRQLLNTGVVVIVILFQPEIRKALEQLGNQNFFGSFLRFGTKSSASDMTERKSKCPYIRSRNR